MKRQEEQMLPAGQYNEGLTCDVTSCIYNSKERACTAEKIHVTSPGLAEEIEETACSTFISAEKE